MMNSTEQTPGGQELVRRLTKQIKLLEIEKKLASRRGFWKGLLCGMLVIVLLLTAAGGLIWQNRAAALEWAASHFLMNYMESIFAGFPDAYMTNRREHVLQVLDDFTNAMQYQRVTREDFKGLAHQAFSALRDQRLTYQELDALLDRLEQTARASP